VPPGSVHVIPPGIGPGGPPPSPKPTPSPTPVPSRQPPAPAPRVLFVGSIFNRRHVVDLIHAFTPIARARPDAALDIVGDNRSYPYEDLRRTIDGEGLQTAVQWHSYVTDERLRDLYANARAFAFLSEYEGLGLTPLEALAAGVPPLLMDTPVARESCGDAALYVPGHDQPGVTRALEVVLFDDSARQRLLDAAPQVLARYSWPRAARETLSVLEAAVLET